MENNFSQIKKRLLSVSVLLFFTGYMVIAQFRETVYQYSVPVGNRRAFLWIPPDCMYVRGVIISFSNLLERCWLEDPRIRKTASEEGLGIIWLGGGDRTRSEVTLTANLRPGEPEVLVQMMKNLADESGYSEIEFAPYISMGHSANGQLSWNIPNWNPERTIAAIPVKTVPLPSSMKFDGIPLCYVVGETTEWPQYRDGRQGDRDYFWPVVRNSAIALREANEDNLVSVVTEPGGGHFDWSERQAEYIALYIRKACIYRLPEKITAGIPPKLKPVSKESGWLTDNGGMEPDNFKPASYKKYKGDPGKAYWFFDKETALAAVAFNGDRKAREKQMLTFVQNGEVLPVAKQGFAPLKYIPEEDGLTFRVEGVFLSELPEELIGSGKRLGHASGQIKFSVITGPAVQTGPETFRIQFDRQGMGGTLWLQEEHPGDEIYRHAVQPGQMLIPSRLTEGKGQVITFPEIENQQAGTEMLELKATSDSGLPADYYVQEGPAVIQDNKLLFTKIPVRSKYPVKVTVVAYQWGRNIEPLYQSEEPVKRTFFITR
jgi:hypothetical protein